ncbi:MAG: transcriptional regulator BetI [Parvularculaceae bacterium]
MRIAATPHPPKEIEKRREQLVSTTIEIMAEAGFNGATLAVIAERADVSPGLVAHYFGDKDGLLEAAFRRVVADASVGAVSRLRRECEPRARVQAIVDTYLGAEHFDARVSAVWLAFWGQAPHAPRLRRVQLVYQRRMLSNLRDALKALLPADEAAHLAVMIAAMIDGVWLRAALSDWSETDSETARALVTQFIDGLLQLERAAPTPHSRTIHVKNPATGARLGALRAAGPDEIAQALERGRAAQRHWAAMPDRERSGILQRAAEIVQARGDAIAELESRNTGRPIKHVMQRDIPRGVAAFEQAGHRTHDRRGETFRSSASAMSFTTREPLGVVAANGGWRRPLETACVYAARALACGNALMFSPSDLTPLSAQALATVVADAGAPDGLLQIVLGYTPRGHRDVHIASPLNHAPPVLLVFAEADLDNAVACALGEGGASVFLERRIKRAFHSRLLAAAAAQKIGTPLDTSTDVGAMVSEQHGERLLAFIAEQTKGGARLLAGGSRLAFGENAHGFFIATTIIDWVGDAVGLPNFDLGPVVTLDKFATDAEIVSRLNGVPPTENVMIFASELGRAHSIALALSARECCINPTGPNCSIAPFPFDHDYHRVKSIHIDATTHACA